MMIAGITIVLMTDTHDNYAYAEHKPTKCIIDIHGERHPITYLNETRQNPDGSYYPGDAFYYLFKWSDRSPEDECLMRDLRIETANLILNHTSRSKGPSELGPITYNRITHHSNDPIVAFVDITGFHYASMVDRCHAKWAKPGESHKSGWERWSVYDMPFMSKEGEEDLTEYEKTEAKRAGSAAWEGWRQFKVGKGAPDLPLCPFKRGPHELPDNPNTPSHLEYYDEKIFRLKMHTWKITKNSTAHSHGNFTTHADPDSSLKFDVRIQELCSTLKPETGCAWGTAQIKPHRKVCIYESLESQGIDPLLPPDGIKPESYIIPVDECFESDGSKATLDLRVTGVFLAREHYANGIPVTGHMVFVGDLDPLLQDPALYVITTKPPLHHHVGRYDAKNLDGTYYHDDPIHIRHEPSWAWKDERATHINFTVKLLHSTLPLKDDTHCMASKCNHTISITPPPHRWLEEIHWYGNGDGASVYVAHTSFAFTNYTFPYEMTAWNLGEPVANGTGADWAELVPYRPEYRYVHSYPVLRDAAEYAFDDRHGVALLYMGSWQEDGSAGDGLLLYPQRRSYNNGWTAIIGGGHDHAQQYVAFDQVHRLSEGRSGSAAASNMSLQYEAPYVQAAMFVQYGYGALLWEWPVSDFVFPERTIEGASARGAIYENISSSLDVYSRDFAGTDTLLYNTGTLVYPEMPFTKHLLVRSVDSHGTTQEQDRLSLKIVPYMGEYLSDYTHDKTMHDTGSNSNITRMIIDDMHQMYQEYAGDGIINTTILRTSAYFEDLEIRQQNSTTPPIADSLLKEIITLTGQYPQPTKTIRMALPYHLGLGVLSPTSLHITINDTTTHILNYKYYSFGGHENITINVRTDNTLSAERVQGAMINLSPPENFGMVKMVKVNGTEVRQKCLDVSCTILDLTPHRQTDITMYNKWGGQAHTTIPPAEPDFAIPRPATSTTLTGIATIVGVLVLVVSLYIIYRRFQRA